MQVGSYTLAFFFLETDRSVQERLLLLVLQLLQFQLVADYFALMENDKNDHSDGQNQHPYGSEEQHKRDLATLIINL